MVSSDNPALGADSSIPTYRSIIGGPTTEKDALSGPEISTSSSDTVFYDTTLSAVPSDVQEGLSGDTSNSPRGTMVHGREGPQGSSRFSQGQITRPSDQRPFRPVPTVQTRLPPARHVHPPPSSYHAASSDNSSSNPGYSHGYQPSPPFGSLSSPYDQQIDFIHFSQPPMAMEHHPSFAYPHPYHSGVPSRNLMDQDTHANYATRLPQQQGYQFHGHSPEASSSAHHPYINTSPYSHSQSPPHHHSPPHFPPSGSFPALNYSPPHSNSPYGYPPPQPFSSSPPLYSPYPAPYQQQQYAPTSPQADRQGWWYAPHHAAVSPPQQFDSGAYQHSHSIPYSRPAHIEPLKPTVSPPMSPSTSVPIVQTSPAKQVNALPSETSSKSSKKPAVRRSYHPNPPGHRSEWVMWAGNVPPDATHDELWHFFNSFPYPDNPANSGVLSIFPISRSSCAFINYEADHHLEQAIVHFNGKALRPIDARCPKLVCRVRKRDDDLKAGVGGQRGIGMHLRWIKEQKARAAGVSGEVLEDDLALDDTSSDSLPEISSLSISSDDDPRKRQSSGSYASTNSSLLARYFPQRYFILKSLTQSDLDLSTEKGLWATQKHNEGILDQAYRTSQDVFLIFSVNKSGEFYGYARMAGPIRRGEHKVSWATRTSESSSSGSSPHSARLESKIVSVSSESTRGRSNLFFSPGGDRLVDESPRPVSSGKMREDTGPTLHVIENAQSAPAELGAARHKLTLRTPSLKHSLDQLAVNMMQEIPPPEEEFELDPMAPLRAIRPENVGDSIGLFEAVAEEDAEKGHEGEDKEGGGGKDDPPVTGERDDWGESFKVEWLSTEKISFQKTRHIRNPWNHDREIKVSRDGTELESGVGRKLLEEWSSLAGNPTTSTRLPAKANAPM